MNLFSWLKSASVSALVITTFAACTSDTTAPVGDRLDAVYVATSVGDQPLPRTVNYSTLTATLIADTLRFSSNGSVTRSTVVLRSTGTAPSQNQVTKSQYALLYEVVGNQLSIYSDVCVDAATCGRLFGTITTGRVTLQTSELGSDIGMLVLSRSR